MYEVSGVHILHWQLDTVQWVLSARSYFLRILGGAGELANFNSEATLFFLI